MPLPARYAAEAAEVVRLWEPAGYFDAQLGIWLAECQAMHEVDGAPTAAELATIRDALRLSADEVATLTRAYGHETNTLLRTVQAKLPPALGNFVHRGNTSSDVLDTSMALQIVRSLDVLRGDLDRVAGRLAALALQHVATLQMARTHGQHAVPQTFGRQVLGWYAEVQRGLDRLARARTTIAVGKLSGEVGTNVFIRSELEAMELWLERDISHSSTERFAFPDAFGALCYAARLLDRVVGGLVVHGEQMARNVERTHGAIYGSRLLNALLDAHAMSRTEAYELVKALAQQALDTGVHLRELASRDARIAAAIPPTVLAGLFTPDFYLRNVDVAYRRLGLRRPG